LNCVRKKKPGLHKSFDDKKKLYEKRETTFHAKSLLNKSLMSPFDDEKTLKCHDFS